MSRLPFTIKFMNKIWAYLGLAYASVVAGIDSAYSPACERRGFDSRHLRPRVCRHAAVPFRYIASGSPPASAVVHRHDAVRLGGADLTSEWRGVRPHWPVHIKAWLILPAMLPAWVISGAFSKDPGIRSLLRTLVHPPNWRWPADRAIVHAGISAASVRGRAFLRRPAAMAGPARVPPWAYAASES